MTRNKTPKLQRHSCLPGSRANHADKHPIGNHHIDRPKSCGYAHRKRRETNREIVGHNPRSGERLDSHYGFRPHLAFLDRCHHLRPKHAMCEGWIMNCHSPGRNSRYRENEKSEKRLRESFAKNLRKSLRVESDEAADFLLVAHVNEIVRASKKLIEVKGQLIASQVLADGGEVGSRLAVQ